MYFYPLLLIIIGFITFGIYWQLQYKDSYSEDTPSEKTEGKIPPTDGLGSASSLESLGDSQREFYADWKDSWESGDPKPLGEQADYLFIYLKELVRKEKYEELRKTLPRLTEEYGEVPAPGRSNHTMKYYTERLLTDAHIIQGHFRKAAQHSIDCCLQYYTYPNFIVFSFTGPTDEYLSLKLAEDDPVRGNDIILCDRNSDSELTDAVKDHIDKVAQEIEHILESEGQDREAILEDWSEIAESATQSENQEGKQGYYAFGQLRRQARLIEAPVYNFTQCPEIKEFVSKITRQAENNVREALQIPKVGEGWVSETELYHLVDDLLEQHNVVHHATPEWLSPQHLDIFVPEADLAIEYQGRQHYEPVDFFGGEERFEERKHRDNKKRELCEENGIELIEWRYDEDLSKEEVEKRIASYV